MKTPYLAHCYRDCPKKDSLSDGFLVYKAGSPEASRGAKAAEKQESKEMKEVQSEITRLRRRIERNKNSFNKSVESKGGTILELKYDEQKRINVSDSLKKIEEARQANEGRLTEEEIGYLNHAERFLNLLKEQARQRKEINQAAIKKDTEEYRKVGEEPYVPSEVEIPQEEVARLKSLILKKKRQYNELIQGDPLKAFEVKLVKGKIDVPKTAKQIDHIQSQARDDLTQKERELLQEMEQHMNALKMEALKLGNARRQYAMDARETQEREDSRENDSKVYYESQQENVEEARRRVEQIKRSYDVTVNRKVGKKKKDTESFSFVEAEDGSGKINVSATLSLIATVRRRAAKSLKDEQKELLGELEKALRFLEDVAGEREIAYSQFDLAERIQDIVELSKERERWVKRLGYDLIKDAYEDAIQTPIVGTKIPRFQEFWGDSIGGVSTQKARQSRQLYFAIVGQQTEFFRDKTPLPEDFGNNHEENSQRYPFMYHEWLRGNGVDVEEVMTKEQAIADMRLELGLSPRSDKHPFLSNVLKGTLSEKHPRMADIQQLDAKENKSFGDWDRLKELANGMHTELKGVADSKILKEILIFAKYADLQNDYLRSLSGANENSLAFTRDVLEQGQHRQLVVEITMMKLQKAMEMIGPQEDLNPAVYRSLAAMFFNEGVARVEKNESGELEYNDDLSSDYREMVAELATSPYFLARANHRMLDEPSRKALKVMKVAAEVKPVLRAHQKRLAFLEAFKKGAVSPELQKAYADTSEASIDAEIAQIEEQILFYTYFLNDVKAVIQDPTSAISQDVFKKIESGHYEKGGKPLIDWAPFHHLSGGMDLSKLRLPGNIITAASLNEANVLLNNVDLNYHAFDLNEHSQMQILKMIGIDASACYQVYLSKLEDNPKLQASNWTDLFLNDFDALAELMDDLIVGEAINPSAKKSFMDSFRSLKGQDPEHLTDMNSGKSGAFLVYRMLKMEIRLREDIEAHEDLSQDEIEAKINGMTIGDKVSHTLKGVWSMMWDFDNPSSAVAGWILFYAGLKGLSYAKNQKGGWATALKLLVVGGAAEIALEKFTGRGLLDRARMGLVSQDMEGTYEAVLMDQFGEDMEAKGITQEEHAGALYELNDVPFHDVLAWYNSSLPSGEPRVPGSKDLFPRQINTGRIFKGELLGNNDPNYKKTRARQVVYAAVQQLFKYKGIQEGASAEGAAEKGKDVLEDHLVTYFERPHQVRDKYYAEQMGPFLDRFKGRRDELTWKQMLRMTIDPADVEATKGKNGWQQEFDYLRNMGEGFLTWSAKEINELSGGSEEFFDDLGDTGEDIKRFLIELGEDGGRHLHIAKEKIAFWYDGNEYEIRRFFGNGWDVIKITGQMALDGTGAIASYSADKLSTVMRQMNKQLGLEDIDVIKNGKELSAEDIVTGGDESKLNIIDSQINPESDNFGLYQKSFYEAFKSKDRSFVNIDESSHEYPDTNVGYFISSLKASDVYVQDPNDKNQVLDALQRQSWEQARAFYKNKDTNLTTAQIEKYMYPITTKVSVNGEEQMYVFWRMPLSNSEELYLKEIGHWTDFMDPRRHMKRLPFKIDPSKGFIDNMIDGFGLNTDFTRTLSGETAKWVAQSMHLSLNTLEFTGNVIAGGGMDLGFDDAQVRWIRYITSRPEATRQAIDEFTTAAGTGDIRTLSGFYDDEGNAEVYKICLAYARESAQHQDLYLGIFDGEGGHKSGRYTGTPPDGFSYEGLNQFYKTVWTSEERGNPPSAKFDELIKSKVSSAGPTLDGDLDDAAALG